MAINITVILCTYNRGSSLGKALEGVAASEFTKSVEWEVLVVDNNSKDQTREVVEEFCRRNPKQFRYLFEPRQGKSHALNAGIREARGEVLAFMDDDVKVEPTWLQKLTADLHNAEWAGAGGRILPEPGFVPPPWLSLNGPFGMGGVLGFFDRGDKAGVLDWVPYGSNMCFRREMFQRYGGFRTDLGPNPGTEIRGEDTEFGRRLVNAGERLRYEPSAVVYHCVTSDHIRKEFFLDWWFDFGRALARESGNGPNILGIPRPYFKMLKTGITGISKVAVRWMISLKPQKRFFYKMLVWRMAGEIAEFCQLASGKDS